MCIFKSEQKQILDQVFQLNRHQKIRWPRLAFGSANAVIINVTDLKSNTHRRHRRDSTVELCRVGGVNAPVGSRDHAVYNFLCCWAIEIGDKWRHNDVIVEKVINIHQNSRSQTVVFSFQIFDRIRRQSSWTSWKFSSHRRRRRNATRQLSRVGGVYWA